MHMHKNDIAFCMYKIEMGYKEPQAKEPERSQGIEKIAPCAKDGW